MIKAKLRFQNEEEKKKYVEECDARFEAELDGVMKKICNRDDLKYLTLTGPTCSGKTTASKKLISEFAERGKKIKIISLDDFFKDQDQLEEEAKENGGKLDFDSEKALDLKALSEFMENLKAGRPAVLPKFDFKPAKRVSTELFSKGDADVIVFEGIQAIYPVFTEMLEKGKETATVCISPLEDIQVGEHIIVPNELRLMRRLTRDYHFRSAHPEFIFYLWQTVRENEDRNILPFVGECEYRINSTLGYDIGMLKTTLEDVLEKVDVNSVYYGKAKEIRSVLAESDAISKDYLPENSLYFEFV